MKFSCHVHERKSRSRCSLLHDPRPDPLSALLVQPTQAGISEHYQQHPTFWHTTVGAQMSREAVEMNSALFAAKQQLRSAMKKKLAGLAQESINEQSMSFISRTRRVVCGSSKS